MLFGVVRFSRGLFVCGIWFFLVDLLWLFVVFCVLVKVLLGIVVWVLCSIVFSGVVLLISLECCGCFMFLVLVSLIVRCVLVVCVNVVFSVFNWFNSVIGVDMVLVGDVGLVVYVFSYRLVWLCMLF